MQSFKDIIRRWDSTSALAADIGQPTKTVQMWLFRDRIPAVRWTKIVAAAHLRGWDDINLGLLASLASKKAGQHPHSSSRRSLRQRSPQDRAS
ncbi:MAG: hypothetical protein H6851_05275 [Geminicoccaceae bacterium]|nr:hypothetical protein [Geminicoccaceae bacterium]